MSSKLRWPQFPKGAHVRTCQECGHVQVNKDPSAMKGDSWRETKCRKCKSVGSLDYGYSNDEVPDDEI